ncbi:MAG TPA: DivIVA domain-containing protein [Mycobacteriales bacterium]|nr:DivIVA domain-containing protein [Mycobacteriales bacterium]
MYRVFDSLDELVQVVETARGVPMSGSCMVTRSTTLDLLDDIREAFPAELKDAGAVLQQRDELLAEAQQRAHAMLSEAKAEHDRLIARAREEAERTVAEATAQHDQLRGAGRSEHEHLVTEGRAEYDRLTMAGQRQHEQLVGDGQAEHDRLVAGTTIHQSAVAAADQIRSEALSQAADIKAQAHSEAEDMRQEGWEAAERMRSEATAYVDERLASMGDLMTKTLRSVENGRAALRTGGAPERLG